jgi:hypothetical protein
MKAYGEVEVYIHIFLTSALLGGELSASCPGRFALEEIPPPRTYWIRGRAEPIAGLDAEGKKRILTSTSSSPVVSRYTD